MIFIWYLIDVDDGIIDEAPSKTAILHRNGFTRSSREYCHGIAVYHVYGDYNDGIGGDWYIVKAGDVTAVGFDWALAEYQKDKEQELIGIINER